MPDKTDEEIARAVSLTMSKALVAAGRREGYEEALDCVRAEARDCGCADKIEARIKAEIRREREGESDG